eukprot:snap_masked-scaffold_54-processed-gene-0.9-mRNA-1 protein AED:1.00 eAED:1.00 QI:0/0/0/0/1/1/2/0/336
MLSIAQRIENKSEFSNFFVKPNLIFFQDTESLDLFVTNNLEDLGPWDKIVDIEQSLCNWNKLCLRNLSAFLVKKDLSNLQCVIGNWRIEHLHFEHINYNPEVLFIFMKLFLHKQNSIEKISLSGDYTAQQLSSIFRGVQINPNVQVEVHLSDKNSMEEYLLSLPWKHDEEDISSNYKAISPLSRRVKCLQRVSFFGNITSLYLWGSQNLPDLAHRMSIKKLFIECNAGHFTEPLYFLTSFLKFLDMVNFDIILETNLMNFTLVELSPLLIFLLGEGKKLRKGSIFRFFVNSCSQSLSNNVKVAQILGLEMIHEAKEYNSKYIFTDSVSKFMFQRAM